MLHVEMYAWRPFQWCDNGQLSTRLTSMPAALPSAFCSASLFFSFFPPLLRLPLCGVMETRRCFDAS